MLLVNTSPAWQTESAADRSSSKLPSMAGYTLLEVLIAVFILAILVLVIFGMAVLGTRSAITNEQKTVAQGIVSEELERLRAIPYNEIIDFDTKISRNGREFVLTRIVELVDDPANGSLAEPLIEDNADYKKMTIRASYSTPGGVTREIVTSTLATRPAGLAPCILDETPVGTASSGSNGELVISGKCLLVWHENVLQIINISNVASPQRITSYSLSSPGDLTPDFIIDGNQGYLATNTLDTFQSVWSIDLTNILQPILLDRLKIAVTFGGPGVLAIQNDNLFVVGTQDMTLPVISKADPGNLVVIGSRSNGDSLYYGGYMSDAVIVGQYLYYTVTDNIYAYLEVVSIIDPTNPISIATLSSNSGNNDVSGIASQGEFLYVVGQPFNNSSTKLNTLNSFLISDPMKPTFVGHATTFFGASESEIGIAQGHAYVEGNNVIRIFSLSAPATPLEVGIITGLPFVRTLTVTDTHLAAYYFDSGSRMIALYDITTPVTPVLVSRIAIP